MNLGPLDLCPILHTRIQIRRGPILAKLYDKGNYDSLSCALTYQRGGCAQVNRHGIPLRLEWPLDDLRFIQKGEDPPAEVSDEL